MAQKTSAGTGMIVTIIILSLAFVTCFILTFVFWSNASAAQNALEDEQQLVGGFISPSERTNDQIVALRNTAQQQRKSLVTYLRDLQQDTMKVLAGDRGRDLENVRSQIQTLSNDLSALSSESEYLTALPSPENQGMLPFAQSIRNTLADLERRLASAEAARVRAQSDLAAETERLTQLQEAQRQTVQSIGSTVEVMQDDVDQYRDEIAQYKAQIDEQNRQLREDFDAQRDELEGRIAELNDERRVNEALIQRLQAELRGKRVQPKDEFALVDANVIGVDPANNNVFINVGRRQNVVLGLTFEIYTEPTNIQADPETGEIEPGKATIEVIQIAQDSSTCRILRERPGNPIIKGDICVNAVYDPDKTYKFLIFGNFDTNRDERFTPQEALEVRAIIESWGGDVADELTGDVDFLVLGQRPVLPPEPKPDAPLAQVQQYLRQRQVQVQYDELLDKAAATSIPVLNLNRLRTLTGDRIN